MPSRKLKTIIGFLLLASVATAQPRRDISLNSGWQTRLVDSGNWRTVDIPHNWDDYGGYRRLRHGNLHGSAIYTRKFSITKQPGKRYFLWFEGVGSYATVRLNGQPVGNHAGGRTSFTLDITGPLQSGANDLEVRADHPANIRDLPWVCGGCSDERGFSEGSQPLGIFRPVHLVITNPIRIEPFGVHIWNDSTLTTLYLETELKNYSSTPVTAQLTQQLLDADGHEVARTRQTFMGSSTVKQQLTGLKNPHCWSPSSPYLYTLVTTVTSNGKLIDQLQTPYGIRWIHWTDPKAPGAHPFTVNGHPVFINGIAEYEHRIGNSHAFTHQEIKARVQQIRAAGFNAFRDAHQPHNLYYQRFWDSLGILWWPQFSAHIWFDTPAFRANFKAALTEWVKERRNSPSVILWGLQNESKLPEDFARECVNLIRQLDPTASSQRLIVTCNGGTGTDWDVPQNWTGTYGGDPKTYGADLVRQVLVGEYGAWRTAGLHGDTANSEDRMCQLLEQKIRLADSVRAQVAGHFVWLYASHDNPGRVQSGEGLCPMDRIGPVNYKGLLTEWEQPVDAYYLFRANFTDPVTDPNVYIVSHTAKTPGRNIVVYSNCDTVELFDGPVSLGKRSHHGIGTHLHWDGVDLHGNTLTAIAYQHGHPAATDSIALHPHPSISATEITNPAPNYNYLYRVNCGGPDYTDHNNNRWLADTHYTGGNTWGSTSWADDYRNVPPFFASQQCITDPIAGTNDAPLFQTFRYGLQKLAYTFPVHPGDYRVELYFIEPWLGAGSPKLDCTGWREFDIAVNNDTVVKNLDIWKEAGRTKAIKKVVNVHVSGNRLDISFPRIASGQAVLSAIAIATREKNQRPAPPSVDTAVYPLEPAYDNRPVKTYKGDTTAWSIEIGVSDKYALTIKYRWQHPDAAARLELRLADGTLIHTDSVMLKTTLPNKFNYISTTTGTMINAGRYNLKLITPARENLRIDELQVQ
jgi:hypothetical protein